MIIYLFFAFGSQFFSQLLASIADPTTIGFHPAKYDVNGNLLPWNNIQSVVDLEMNYYLQCPIGKHGYPVFVYNTFMSGSYESAGYTILPGTQLGFGIISYLKYFHLTNRSNPKVLQWAVKMGDYIANEALTPSFHSYPSFPRSTGINLNFPILVCSQADIIDGIETIEPDKGGIAGYALYLLYKETGNKTYLKIAINAADTLVYHQIPGDNSSAPWPFRVDALGLHYQPKSCNMVYILRLFDVLINEQGLAKYQASYNALWKWIRDFQIPSPNDPDGSLWVGFFEDMIDISGRDRTSWCPLETARYLVEKKESLDKNWRALVENLFAVSQQYASKRPGNVIVMGEQDNDHKPWGGACSNWAAVTALYGCATKNANYTSIGKNTLAWLTYFVDKDGCPSALADTRTPQPRGGWQQDCHTDVIHNLVDGINALNGRC